MLPELLVSTGNDCSPTLTPKIAPWMSALLNKSGLVKEWLNTYGSPCHIAVNSEFKRNAKDLLAPLKSRGVSGGLCFARKANKLPWFVTAAKEEGLGIDTASYQELEETLSLGVSPKNITVTAIGKDQKLIQKAIQAGSLLIIDNMDELNLVKATAESLNLTANIGLRFSGFEVDGNKVFSRFGLPITDANQILSVVASYPLLNLNFLHAHLDRYDINERAQAARQLLTIADHASKHNIKITSIDLGGGILIRYLQDKLQWEEFVSSLIASVKGDRPSFTFLGDGLGYVKAGDTIVGKADLYPAWNNISKERFISAILDHKENGTPLYKELVDRKINLFFEPGRALLDNVGITITNVSFRKRDTLGNLLIGLTMNRFNLRPFRAEFCLDPIFLSHSKEVKIIKEGAYLVGCLCSESDIIYRRKLKLAFLPEPGDAVCFINTAGYLMHHLEVGTHGNPLPSNLLIDSNTLEIQSSITTYKK